MNEKIEIKNYDNTEIDLTNKKIITKPLSEILAPKIKAMGLLPDDVKLNLLNVLAKNPALEKADKASTMLAIATAMEARVSLNPMDAEVAFIPYANGLSTITQMQIMWKGYRSLILKEANGIVDAAGFEIKDGDIKEWDIVKNEFILNDDFWNKDFNYQRARAKKETIGYLGIVFLNEAIYGQKNFGSFMDLEQINEHKKNYGSKTKINDFEYGRKTVIKKVIRDNRHRFIWKNNNERINVVLEKDQAAQDEKGQLHYVENN